jgi:hypothetical protein
MVLQSADTIFVNGRVCVRYTRGSAYAEFAEDRKGTLEPAKLADLVIFHEDLFKMEPKKVLTTPVDLTMVGGRLVFERAAGTP